MEGEYKRIKGLRAFSIRIRVVVWTRKNDTETISVNANRFENGTKRYRFRLKTVHCGRGLSPAVRSLGTFQKFYVFVTIGERNKCQHCCGSMQRPLTYLLLSKYPEEG